MSEGLERPWTGEGGIPAKWLGSPVRAYADTLANIGRWIPSFERRVFGLEQRGDELFRLNERLDTVVRRPSGTDQTYVPVGVVSKNYSLVQHTDVLGAALGALAAAGIKPSNLDAELRITEYGERMALSIFLPEEYGFDPGDGHKMSLRLELWNSVEGSVRLRVLMGWFRFVCGNGLIVGVIRSDVRRRHVNDLTPEDVGPVLKAGVKQASFDKKNLAAWRDAKISPDELGPWVDGGLKKTWGFKAAARTYHIAHTGSDCDVLGPYKDEQPTTVNVRAAGPVPGAPGQARDLFDVSQILAWLAKERRDLQEQLEWREQIPGLMAALASNRP